MSEADNVYDPLYGSFVGDQGAWSTAKMYFTVPPNGVAKLHVGAHFQAPGLPNQTAGTVDVYGLQILDATLEAGNTEEEDTAASALLLKHKFLDGGADDVTLATLGEVLLEPTLTTLRNFLVSTARAPWPRPASRWAAAQRAEEARALPAGRRAPAGRNAGAGYERRDWLPVNKLGGATRQQVAQRVRQQVEALLGAKADATLLASYATNAALSASETALQSALDAILAELAALGRASNLGAPSRKQRRSQPALHGSSLCCAGQRRRHAEHHGRLLLRGH